MKCENCVHWTPDKENKYWLKEDHQGECDVLGGVVEINLVSGHNGAYVKSIFTPINFFCAAFHEGDK